MSQTEVTRIPKPKAENYEGSRKLILVPILMLSPQAPKEGLKILERYWTEVREQVNNLEGSFGQIVHVYHEWVYSGSNDGLKSLEYINPYGQSFIETLCRSTANMVSTEDQSLVEEASDWPSCLSFIGSGSVAKTLSKALGLSATELVEIAMKAYRDSTDGRYTYIRDTIDKTLGDNDMGILFIREDHKIQFPEDVQVFYIAPRALDDLKKWIDGQMSMASQIDKETHDSSEDVKD